MQLLLSANLVSAALSASVRKHSLLVALQRKGPLTSLLLHFHDLTRYVLNLLYSNCWSASGLMIACSLDLAMALQASVPAAACYICRLTSVPGKFLPQKAKELGVAPGPLFGQLKAGIAVQGKDRLIQPDEVLPACMLSSRFRADADLVL